jgi:phosphoribosylglycinamide formyltransferase 1
MKKFGRPIRIGVMLSGSGTNLQAIMDNCENGMINGKVVVAGADKPDAYGLVRARGNGIPTFVVDYKEIFKKYPCVEIPHDFSPMAIHEGGYLEKLKEKDFEGAVHHAQKRACAEKELLEKLAPFNIDLLVLAGFMRLLTPYFIQCFSPDPMDPRIMNIHPALCPAFPGTDGYGETFSYGCKFGACTVFFVDKGEDTGPIIGQRVFPIYDSDTLDDVKARGLKREYELYSKCIQAFAEGRLRLEKTANGRFKAFGLE